MARRSTQPRRHRMRSTSRRDSARSWIASGATVSVKAYATRYGVDRYTAHADLLAIGFPLASCDDRWAVRPPAVPKRRHAEPADDAEGWSDQEWIWVGDQRMFVVGYTPGGAPFGWVEDVTIQPPPPPAGSSRAHL